MDDMTTRLKDLYASAMAYSAEVDRLIDGYPVFRTPELHQVSVVMKMAMTQCSQVVVGAINLFQGVNASRNEIQAELDKCRALIETLRSGAITIASNFGEGTYTNETPSADTELPAFPYTTRALEAARAAATKFWTVYDPERPPLQKTVAAFIADQGVPVRQAQELATAIKPDGVTKA